MISLRILEIIWLSEAPVKALFKRLLRFGSRHRKQFLDGTVTCAKNSCLVPVVRTVIGTIRCLSRSKTELTFRARDVALNVRKDFF